MDHDARTNLNVSLSVNRLKTNNEKIRIQHIVELREQHLFLKLSYGTSALLEQIW